MAEALKHWPWILCGVVAVVTGLVTATYMRWAKSVAVLDHPGPRSAHREPSLTGGGVGIVAGVMVGLVGLGLMGRLEVLQLVIFLAALLLAVVGALDDRHSLSTRSRLVAQVVASSIVLGMAAVEGLVAEHSVWLPAGLLALIWLTNLFNFMDGIDGIACAQTLCIVLPAIWLSSEFSAFDELLMFAGAACAAFLLFNWPPARLFMGDTGSLFVGILLGSVAVLSSFSGELSVWVWLILWASFIADASLTLALRARRGERLDHAHSQHAYQRLARLWAGHRPVTLAMLAVNVFWLWPLAILAASRPGWAAPACVLAYLPLLGIVGYLDSIDAGARESAILPES